MKTRRKEVVEYKIVYVSEDGLFESDDPKKVEEYEANCKYRTFEPVFTITTSLLDYDHSLKVYKCESEQEYQELITFCGIELRTISEYDKQSARKDYILGHKYWVPIQINGADEPDTFYVETLDIILREMEQIEMGYSIFKSELEETRKLVKEEKVEYNK